MNPVWLLPLAGALAGALLTLLLGGLVLQLWLLPKMRREMEAAQDEFEQRVRRGVEAAGRELLPAFREQVRLGFHDAMKTTETGELVENYASAVNRAADMISDRIGNLFGLKPRR